MIDLLWLDGTWTKAGRRSAPSEALRRALDRQRAQAWWAPWRWHDIESASRYVLGYLGTKHTTDYVTGGHAVRLARMIEGVA